ncbi:hypothetical protein SAMN02745857_00780 [Andreprevotia lacus DSM 23236]|jgi:hypothetical protein|uniref:Uncharacterized protein n=1 Tax=Andreprevotia lacus DSM 23236 TaxID=1121001 RepID=A0A1W1X7E5_9NEIS|nr:hypothetical protein [Andreprevotia lacus]SMC19744.1 hypothetical protein SAMN02745857_00780 [Andreprevotia lacus DSM 23236]
MRSETVILQSTPASPVRRLALRELSGRDELAVEGVDTRAAVALLDRLLDHSAAPRAGSMPATERDALLAALYRQLWGDRIVSTLSCPACHSKYDLSFSLRELQQHLAAGRTAQGSNWRAPTAEEEMTAAEHGARDGVAALAAVLGMSPAGMAAACAELEAQAPIIDVELTAPCSECGAVQDAHFDLQSFLLQRLLGERALLLSEIHRLAGSYGWSLREILALPRSTRRALIETGDAVARQLASRGNLRWGRA